MGRGERQEYRERNPQDLTESRFKDLGLDKPVEVHKDPGLAEKLEEPLVTEEDGEEDAA